MHVCVCAGWVGGVTGVAEQYVGGSKQCLKGLDACRCGEVQCYALLSPVVVLKDPTMLPATTSTSSSTDRKIVHQLLLVANLR